MTDLRDVLWEPCPSAVHSPINWGLSIKDCPLCDGTGRVLNQAAVRTAWAIYDWLLERRDTLEAKGLVSHAAGNRNSAHLLQYELEAAGASRPDS